MALYFAPPVAVFHDAVRFMVSRDRSKKEFSSFCWLKRGFWVSGKVVYLLSSPVQLRATYTPDHSTTASRTHQELGWGFFCVCIVLIYFYFSVLNIFYFFILGDAQIPSGDPSGIMKHSWRIWDVQLIPSVFASALRDSARQLFLESLLKTKETSVPHELIIPPRHHRATRMSVCDDFAHQIELQLSSYDV